MINNKTVDVKTSLLKPWWDIRKLHLLAHKVSHKANIYIRVFITSDKKEAILAGWTSRANLEKYAKEWEYNNHTLFKLSLEYMSRIEDLKLKEAKHE